MNSDITQITNVLESYRNFVNSSDAEKLGSLYAQDAILFPDRMDAYEGAENITGFYRFAFSMLSLELQFEIDPEKIFIENQTAYATTTSTGTRSILSPDKAETVPEINRELWVFKKVSGNWKIARYCFNKDQ